LIDKITVALVESSVVCNCRIHSAEYFLPAKSVSGNNDDIFCFLLGKRKWMMDQKKKNNDEGLFAFFHFQLIIDDK
jgi:hypothetical protein